MFKIFKDQFKGKEKYGLPHERPLKVLKFITVNNMHSHVTRVNPK